MSTRKLKTKGITEIPREALLSKYAGPDTSSKIIEVDSIHVHLRENERCPSKPTLLALHGICDSLHTWENWEESLEEHFHFIRIDLPFFGLTKVHEQTELHRDFYNHFINNLLNQLKLDKVHLLGHSLGAYISWNYAVFDPKRVESVVLVSPPAYPQKPPAIVHLAGFSPVRKIASSFTPRMALPIVMKKLFYDQQHIQEHLINRYYDLTMCEGNRANYLKVFDMINSFIQDYPHKLKDLKQPTLIIWGKDDLWVPAKNSKLWQKDVPHAEIKLFDRMRHMPQYEDDRGTLKEFLDFFQLPFED